jgi:acyl-CoA reductase-like NAD-dependent aldehyde dehydrogenase
MWLFLRAMSDEKLDAIVARAREAQKAWAAQPVFDRISVIKNVRDRLLDRAHHIAETVQAEVGKPDVEVLLGEILPSADVVDYWARTIEDLLEPSEIELDRLSFPKKSGLCFKDPRGVIAVIMPWNFPLALPLRTLVPALMAGNAVIFKPSEVAPRTGALIEELFDSLLPAGVLTVVQGGGERGAELAASDVDLVVFTGSVASGKKVAMACAERLSPCALELGGKDAAIVLADANLERAARGVVWGALNNTGQNCASIERVYVEKAIAEPFVARVAELTKELRRGTDFGPLATAEQRDTVVRHVDAAKNAGATIVTGGEPREPGHGYQPTVMRVQSDDLDIMREETFGPVIPIAVVESADDAVARANASRFGLTASIWTKKIARGEALAKKLQVGVVTINNHAFTGALPSSPWSGHGDSGYGITNSPLALDTLTRPRVLVVDRNRAKREVWWYPYTDTARQLGFAFAVLRSRSSGIFKRIGALFALLRLVPKRLAGG